MLDIDIMIEISLRERALSAPASSTRARQCLSSFTPTTVTLRSHFGTPKWMSQSDVFRPSNGPLLVRGNLSDGTGSSHDFFRKERPGTKESGGYRFGHMSHNSFFARHNPHPGRVRHIKGLLDIPICAVNDNGYFANARYSMNFPPNTHDNNKLKQYTNKIPVNAINVNSQMHPINTITGLQYFMGKPLNFRVFREKAVPKVGMVPVTEAWRDELRALTEAVGLASNNLPKVEATRPRKPATAESRPRTSQYSCNTGRLIPPPSRAMSRQASRAGSRSAFFDQLEHLSGEPDHENMVLQMLCQILQTDDVNAVQAWLVAAGDREKSMVLDMIKTALSTNDEYNNKKVDRQYMEPNDRSRSALPGLPQLQSENLEGQIIGDHDLNKHIDRLSLVDGEPPRTPNYQGDSMRLKFVPKADDGQTHQDLYRPIPEDDDDNYRPPVMNGDMFRPSKSRVSNRPRSKMSQSRSPKPTTPLYQSDEPKLRYTMTSAQEQDTRPGNYGTAE